MQYIKIFHQDGLIYFDKIRVADLVLLRMEEENRYLLTIDIATFEGTYSAEEIAAIELEQKAKLNPSHTEYAHAVYEDYVELAFPDELDGLEINTEDSDEKRIYFGWNVPLHNNRLMFRKNGSAIHLCWTASADDAFYFHEKAKDSAVDIQCSLNVYVFTIEEWKIFAQKGAERLDRLYGLLRTEITAATHPHLSEMGRAQEAWAKLSEPR